MTTVRLCRRCGITQERVDVGQVVVSPAGVAHEPGPVGPGPSKNTGCGILATGIGWRWPPHDVPETVRVDLADLRARIVDAREQDEWVRLAPDEAARMAAVVEALTRALQQIEHYPIDAHGRPVDELLAVKQIAHDAADQGGET